jgi:hypothetical protein
LLTLELKRAGESRKSAGLRPPGMLLKKDDGVRGRDGGVMVLYLDAPPAASADPPSMSVKLVLANEKDPGLEFAAGASMLPEDEVVIGERRRGEEVATRDDQTHGAALRRDRSCVCVRGGCHVVSGVYVRAGRHGGGRR